MVTLRMLTAPLCAAALMVAACGSGTPSDDAGVSTAATTPATAAASPKTSTSTPTATTGASTHGSYRAEIMAWGREFAACARAHGQATFPDPVWPADTDPADGDDSWGLALFPTPGGKGDLSAAIDACLDVARRMPPNPDVRPPNATTLNHMRQFAACMRQHGLADFPDPHDDGTFPIMGGPYQPLAPFSYGTGFREPLKTAFEACIRYRREWRVRATR